MHVSVVARWLLLALATLMAMGFHTPAPKRSAASRGSEFQQRLLAHPLRLFAKKQSSKGDGFGAKTSSAKASPSKSSSLVNAIPADKTSLEKQWDVFTSITDLEIRPQGDPNGEEYQKFEVVDVVVRCGGSGSGKNSTAVTTATNGNNNSHKGTKWFRIGKVCAAKESDVAAALMLQKGLIFWTAVHMRRELVVAGGRSGAAALELGYTPATMYMGSETDGPLEGEAMDRVRMADKRVPVQDILSKSIGFRPDWNPPGFTYKRRETDAMKKKKRSKLEEILDP